MANEIVCDVPLHEYKTGGLQARLARQDDPAPRKSRFGLTRASDNAHNIRVEADFGHGSSSSVPIVVRDESGRWQHYSDVNTTLWRRFAEAACMSARDGAKIDWPSGTRREPTKAM